jgi:Tol biopolymer transport system component
MPSKSAFLSLTLAVAACGGSTSKGADGSVQIDGGGSSDAAVDAMDQQPDAGLLGSAKIYYFGDFEIDGNYDYGLWDVPTGTGSILNLMDLTGASFSSRIGSPLAISPDGMTLAAAGVGSTGTSEAIHLYAVDGSGAPTVLHTAASADVEIQGLKFSPDGALLSFVADAEANGNRSLYVIPVAGGTPKRVSQANDPAVDQDVYNYEWAPNSTHIAYMGDLVVQNEEGLWIVDVTADTPSPLEIIGDAVTTANQGPASNLAFDTMNRLYFRSDHELADNQYRLYRTDLDGSNLIQLPGTALSNGSGEAAVGPFAISPTGDAIAFCSDSPTANLYQVYTMDLSSSTAALVSDITKTLTGTLQGPSFLNDMVWSPDGNRLALSADWGPTDNDFDLYILPTSGTPGGSRLTGPTVSNGDVEQVSFTAASDALVLTGDLEVNNQNQLYVVADLSGKDQDPADLIVDPAVAAGNIFGFVLTDQ